MNNCSDEKRGDAYALYMMMHDCAVSRVGALYKCLVDSCSDDRGRYVYGCCNGDDELCSPSLSLVCVSVTAERNLIGCSENSVGGDKACLKVLRYSDSGVFNKDSDDISRDVDSGSIDNDAR